MNNIRERKVNSTITNATQQAVNLMAPVGEGMDWKMFPSRYNSLIEQRSMYMESKVINFNLANNRTMGIPNAYPLRFNHYPADDTIGIDMRISSSSSADTSLVINVRGLDKDWNDQTVSIALDGSDGQTPVAVPDIGGHQWLRLNKMWVESGVGGAGADGACTTNAGDIYLSVSTATITLGVPQTNLMNAIVATCNNSTMGTYSVARGRNFHYMRGNVFTDATQSKELNIQEIGFFNWNEAKDGSGERNGYQVGTYGVSGNISYGFQAAAGWGEFSDICLRINNDTGTNSCVLYYEYMLTDATIDNNNSQQAPIQDV